MVDSAVAFLILSEVRTFGSTRLPLISLPEVSVNVALNELLIYRALLLDSGPELGTSRDFLNVTSPRIATESSCRSVKRPYTNGNTVRFKAPLSFRSGKTIFLPGQQTP